MSSTAVTTASDNILMIDPTGAEAERKTYWCHECDMSVSLVPSTSSTAATSDLLCPHCHTHFLELMDSPLSPSHQNPFGPNPSSLLSTPYFRRFMNQNLSDTDNDDNLILHSNSATGCKGSVDFIPNIKITTLLLEQLELDAVGLVCAVCRDPILVNDHCKQLPCKHLYHADCIVPWLTHHKSCPLCRFKLVTEEEEEDAELWRIRSQLILGMMRFAEMMEDEEGGEFYGLQTTLRHIAARHGLIIPDSDGQGSAEIELSFSTTHMVEEEAVAARGSVDIVEEVSRFDIDRGVINLGRSDGGASDQEIRSDRVIESGETVIAECRVSR